VRGGTDRVPSSRVSPGSNRKFADKWKRITEAPASQAGIEVGDEISAIDGVPAERLTLSAIYEMFGSLPSRRTGARLGRGASPRRAPARPTRQPVQSIHGA